jgi:hypothetical protein
LETAEFELGMMRRWSTMQREQCVQPWWDGEGRDPARSPGPGVLGTEEGPSRRNDAIASRFLWRERHPAGDVPARIKNSDKLAKATSRALVSSLPGAQTSGPPLLPPNPPDPVLTHPLPCGASRCRGPARRSRARGRRRSRGRRRPPPPSPSSFLNDRANQISEA